MVYIPGLSGAIYGSDAGCSYFSLVSKLSNKFELTSSTCNFADPYRTCLKQKKSMTPLQSRCPNSHCRPFIPRLWSSHSSGRVTWLPGSSMLKHWSTCVKSLRTTPDSFWASLRWTSSPHGVPCSCCLPHCQMVNTSPSNIFCSVGGAAYLPKRGQIESFPYLIWVTGRPGVHGQYALAARLGQRCFPYPTRFPAPVPVTSVRNFGWLSMPGHRWMPEFGWGGQLGPAGYQTIHCLRCGSGRGCAG